MSLSDLHTQAGDALQTAGELLVILVPRQGEFATYEAYLTAYRQHVADFGALCRMARKHRAKALEAARTNR